jgi:hypothetical protein
VQGHWGVCVSADGMLASALKAAMARAADISDGPARMQVKTPSVSPVR